MKRSIRVCLVTRSLRLSVLLILAALFAPLATRAEALRGDELRLDEMRFLGTHNSFHRWPFIAFHPRHRYRHAPLTVQLERYRVRALELDLHLSLRGKYEIYHIAFIDDRSHCKAFEDCLRELRRWSDAHPEHDPLLVWLEIKDDAGGVPIDSVRPVDAMLRHELGDRLLTPDDVRGSHATLREALETDGWPTRSEAQGRILFLLDGDAKQTSDYTSGYRHVRGRVMFPGAEPHQFHMGWAGVTKINDPARPLIAAARAIRMLTTTTVCVAQLSDAECRHARDLALRSGANVLLDDFVSRVPGRAYHLDIDEPALAER